MSQGTYSVALAQGGTIDDKAGIIKGVAVMTMGAVPDRGLFVDMKTLTALKACCDKYASGVKVKADHGSGIFGTTAYLKNFYIEDDKLKADLYVLDSDSNRDKLLEMAREIPDTFGLSVSIEQEVEESAGNLNIRPTAVDSIDLVTEPAANPAGLFSKQQVDANPKSKSKMNPEEFKSMCDELKKNFESFKTEVTAKFSKYDAIWPDVPPSNGDEPAAKSTPFSKQVFADEMKAMREEFAKKITEGNEALVAKVAGEFSKLVGTSTIKVAASGGEADAAAKKQAEAGTSEAFEARVQAHFAKLNSKTKAMSAAVADDNKETGGKGYSAFISKGRSVKYTKE